MGVNELTGDIDISCPGRDGGEDGRKSAKAKLALDILEVLGD